MLLMPQAGSCTPMAKTASIANRLHEMIWSSHMSRIGVKVAWQLLLLVVQTIGGDATIDTPWHEVCAHRYEPHVINGADAFVQ